MRDWAASVRPASFRGARFFVDSDGPEVGRRVVAHEISGGERVITEDMGRRARRVFVDAYVAGDRADSDGRRLEQACEAPGPALLVLPFDAAKPMHCEACTRDRRKDRAGYIAYRLDLVEAGAADGAAASPIGAMRTAFDAGVSAAGNAFSGLFR